jgi:hypothetical protein
MNEEVESGLLQDVKELDAVAYATAADGTDGARTVPDQKKKGDSDGTDGTDGDGTDGQDTDGTDGDTDGTDSGDADGTDGGDSDGTDNA